MTETTVDIEFIKACSNSIINTELNHVMQRNLEQIPPQAFDDADLEQGPTVPATLTKTSTYFDALAAEATDPEDQKRFQADMDSLIPCSPTASGTGAAGLCFL